MKNLAHRQEAHHGPDQMTPVHRASAPVSAATAATVGMSIMPRAPSTNSTRPPATGAAYD